MYRHVSGYKIPVKQHPGTETKKNPGVLLSKKVHV